MKIKYTGKSGWTSVNFKGSLYKFNPECEVTDPDVIDYCLKDSTFIKAEDEAIYKAAEELLKPTVANECDICHKSFKTPFALAGHKRSHKDD